ncbi:hypothetical protein C265_22976 [Cupriavidus sp. GA3-3]|uniref:hypothetical protein n=1 Tax=Cupriavidus TaxID=106589 RepID=UPI00032EA4BD|nr:hypothetical protein [Cupriavidus sp. GA3-3]EON17350.1 hypothetical protein C265_22976 [Cupriavidus sp. GA3-3]
MGGTLIGAAVVLLCLLAVPLWKLFAPNEWRQSDKAQTMQPEASQSEPLANALQNVLPSTSAKNDRVLDLLSASKLVQPFPATGSVVAYQEIAGQKLAAFTVDATGTGVTLHAVKLEEWNTRRPVLMTFVPGGSTAKLEVPLGIYRIKIASGDTWYGMDDLFGPSTRVQTAEKPLQFYAEGNTITGHTLHLQTAAGGNRFPTAEAARREF